MTALDASDRMARTKLGAIGGVLVIVMAIPWAIAGWNEVQMASDHGHPISEEWLVMDGVLAVVWGLVSGILFLRASAPVRALVVPGVCGVAMLVVAFFANYRELFAPQLIGEDREAFEAIWLAAIPGLVGLGHLVAQRAGLRRSLDRVCYALAVLATLGFVAHVAARF